MALPPLTPEQRQAALEKQMGAAGFWDDPDAAAKVNAEYARVGRKLETYRALESDTADLDGLVELAEEDPELAEELEETLQSIEQRLAALEEERLFTGPYDAGDALVTVNAGADQDGNTRARGCSLVATRSRTAPTASARVAQSNRSP